MPPEGQVDEYEQWRQQRIRVIEAACALLNAMMLFNRDRVELTSAEWLDVLDEIRGKLEGHRQGRAGYKVAVADRGGD